MAYEQWGYKEQLTEDATNYPIPFSSFCYVIAFVYKHPSSGSTAHAVIADKTNSGFKFYVGQYSMMPYPASDASGWWLAWGIQQWGYNTQSEDYNVKVALPIAYAIKHYIVVSNAEDKYAGNVYVTGSYKLTLTNFMLSKTESTQPVFWISLGIQQWGTTQNAVIFPLKFTQFVRVFCTNNCPENSYSSYAMNASVLTLTGFKMRTTSNPTSNEVCAWLAVGI